MDQQFFHQQLLVDSQVVPWLSDTSYKYFILSTKLYPQPQHNEIVTQQV